MSERTLFPASHGMSPARRLMSIDALRGFDMFWIIGADALFIAWEQMSKKAGAVSGHSFSLAGFIAKQLQHCDWEGLHFYDLIFPLFLFIVGVSMVFSLPKSIEQVGRSRTLMRIFRRSCLLFLLGFLHFGGFSATWPDIRLMGVLQRIGLCYLFAGLIFCFFDLRKMVAICIGLLVGYWALMSFVPIRDIQLDYDALAKLSAQSDVTDPRSLFLSTTNTVTGQFQPGRNLADHIDFQYLPGEKYDNFYDPEGLLSTLPAIATCLLGVFAGLLLRSGAIMDQKKVIFLIAAGFIAINIGLFWSLQFPIVKKIWTSSFVLVTGGISAIFLGLFYLVVDIWKYQKWCQPFVWMGMNSITIYLASEIINFRKLAQRFVGGDIHHFMDRHFLRGSGELLVTVIGLLLAFWLVRFLYRKQIFLRV